MEKGEKKKRGDCGDTNVFQTNQVGRGEERGAYCPRYVDEEIWGRGGKKVGGKKVRRDSPRVHVSGGEGGRRKRGETPGCFRGKEGGRREGGKVCASLI